ncbi:MAG: hypothetical protein L0H59_03100 [Tomitella sp.]|nr:hypothetical protein [Tomitella sp.]
MAYSVSEDEFDTPEPSTVRTSTMADYLAEHPMKGMFPPTSELATKIIMAVSYVLIVLAIVYIVLRATGVTG